jgi:hypothetical protein
MIDKDNYHPLRTVRVGSRSANVDEQLAPLITELWMNGFATMSSCQDGGEGLADLARQQAHLATYADLRRGFAYVDFTVHSGLTFLTAVANAGPRDAFYVRMVHWAAPDAWDASVKVDDDAASDERRESAFGLWMLQIHFPKYDIPEITRRLVNFRAGRLVAPAPTDWTTVKMPVEDPVGDRPT